MLGRPPRRFASSCEWKWRQRHWIQPLSFLAELQGCVEVMTLYGVPGRLQLALHLRAAHVLQQNINACLVAQDDVAWLQASAEGCETLKQGSTDGTGAGEVSACLR